MTKLHRKTTDERLYAPADDAFVPSAQSERERHMAQFHIGYDGLRYHRKGYRYDRLEDAVAYANLTGSRLGRDDTVGAFTQGKTFAWPTDAEEALMVSLGIRFDHGAYRFESFRYDELSDAVNYAKRAPRRQGDDRS
jgi:hypothetical protein